MLPTAGGAPQDVIDDLTFLAAAGQVQAPEADLDTAQYWDFDLLAAARD